MKNSANLFVLVLALFMCSSFTAPNIINQKSATSKKTLYPTYGGFTYQGVNYDATADPDTGVITDLTTQSTSFTVTSFSGYLDRDGGRINISVSLSNSTNFYYSGGFFTPAPDPGP